MPGHKAKKKTSRSIEPAVRYLRYTFNNSGTAGTETSHYIDLAKDLSSLNRRLYRQGKYYYVKKITVVSRNTRNVETGDQAATSGGSISVSTCPDSWVAAGAWRRGFMLWNNMHKEAMRASGDVTGTWHDYKVHLSNDSRAATLLTPIDNGGNGPSTANNTEWAYSRMVTSFGTETHDEFAVHLLGDHSGSAGSFTSVGLIKSYGESRSTVNIGDPEVQGSLSDDPLANLFNDGETTDEILGNLEVDGDVAPYDTRNYPGDGVNMPKPLVVQQSTLSDGKAVLGGFRAMCGVIEFESVSPIANDTYNVLIEMAVGDYRGVKAEAI